MDFRLLGPLEAVGEDGSLPLGRPQQRAVLAILLLEANRAVSTDRLIDSLWPEKPPGKPQMAIQGYVSALRKLLGREAIETSGGGYLLRVEADAVDSARFEDLRRRGEAAFERGAAGEAARLLREALALWRGPALADFAYDAWAQQEIGRLEELRLVAHEELCQARLALGEHAELVGELEGLVAEHPLREGLRGQLMLALYRSGRQAEALDGYQQGRERLAEELGIDPSPELQRLYRQILNHDSGLAPAEPPAGPSHNVPTPPNRLIGRQRELEQVKALLRRDDVRLVTITGAGGTGKTRFAQQVAVELGGEFRDGARWAALAPVTSSELVVPTIAQALGVRETEGEPVEDTLAAYLLDKELLLLLDNFEHVLPAAGAVGALVSAAPEIKVMVTSRAPVRLSVEHEWPLAPLPLPRGSAPDVLRLAEVDSVALFVERAQAVRPDFALDEENADAVAEICDRLDGLPLAIELAAPRIKLLPPHALRDRLAQRLRLLTEGAQDLPQRQRTLRDTIEWSYQLLDEDAQLLFDRMAVFVGGCSLDAIEAICNPDGSLDVFALLSSLVDNSLLRQEGGSEPRFLMLETLNEFAAERLEARGELAEARRRHLQYFRLFAEAEAARLRGPEQTPAMERLALEQGNVRVACATALHRGDNESALALTAACAYFWESRGQFFEAREWFDRVLPGDDGSGRGIRAEVLFWAGRLAMLQGGWREAIALLNQAGELARASDDSATEALALGKAGWATVETGEMQRGIEAVERALDLAGTVGDEWIRAEVLNDLNCATYRFDVARALDACNASLELRRKLGDVINIADSLNNMGYLLVLANRADEARPPLDECYALAAGLGDTRHVALAVGNLAIVDLVSGDAERARERFRECIELSEKLGDKRGSLEALVGMAAFAALDGDHGRAALISGAVTGLHRIGGEIPSPGETLIEERWLRAARDAFGAEEWDATAERGESLTMEQAIALALSPRAPSADGVLSTLRD